MVGGKGGAQDLQSSGERRLARYNKLPSERWASSAR